MFTKNLSIFDVSHVSVPSSKFQANSVQTMKICIAPLRCKIVHRSTVMSSLISNYSQSKAGVESIPSSWCEHGQAFVNNTIEDCITWIDELIFPKIIRENAHISFSDSSIWQPDRKEVELDLPRLWLDLKQWTPSVGSVLLLRFSSPQRLLCCDPWRLMLPFGCRKYAIGWVPLPYCILEQWHTPVVLFNQTLHATQNGSSFIDDTLVSS
jgi:hypothetical protein